MGGAVDAITNVIQDVIDINVDVMNLVVGAGQIDIIDVGRGVITLTEAAATGDTDAILALATLVVSGALAVGSAGTGSTWFASTLSIVASWATVYNIATTLESIGAISQQELDFLKGRIFQMQQQALNAYNSMSIMGNKNKWMAGGDLYNSVYAGGFLFNQTGSRSQAKFLGIPDANSNKRLGRMLGNDHEFHRVLGVEKIGTENFSVLTFKNK